MSEHTRGPWSIQRYTNYEGFSIWAEGAGCIAERWWASPVEDIPILANAQLIAAAPEMLAALEGLYSETVSYITVNHLGDPHHNQTMKLARAAIAKAKPEAAALAVSR